MYRSTTDDISVSVEPLFLDHESVPDKNVYVWAYRVKIENQGKDIVQLRTRHWVITDAFGRVQQVHGPGVVGEQPILRPGESFEYTSGTPLSTPSGIMGGTYSMQAENGRIFDVTIPTFSLDIPHTPKQLN